MRRIIRLVVLTPIVTAVVVALQSCMILQSTFDKDPKYAVVCVMNRTDVPVAGEFGWGDNAWEPFRIDAEREKAFWWEYGDGRWH